MNECNFNLISDSHLVNNNMRIGTYRDQTQGIMLLKCVVKSLILECDLSDPKTLLCMCGYIGM